MRHVAGCRLRLFPIHAGLGLHRESDGAGACLYPDATREAVRYFRRPASIICLDGQDRLYCDYTDRRRETGFASRTPNQAEPFWRDSARFRRTKSGEESPHKTHISHGRMRGEDRAKLAPPLASPTLSFCLRAGCLSSESSILLDAEREVPAQPDVLAESRMAYLSYLTCLP